MASPRYDEPVEHVKLDVNRLETPDSSDSDSVVMVKFTDELFNTLIAAQKKNAVVRLRMDEKTGTIIVDNSEFSLVTQPFSDETDAICVDSRTKKHRTAGSIRCKYQIQATDKSFAETRVKAQKLAEEEKSKGVKDASKHRNKHISSSTRVGSAPSSRHSSPLLSKAANDSQSRISPNKSNHVSGTNGSTGSNGRFVHHLAGDLRKRKPRIRIVHLLITGKFSSSEEVYKHLRKDGLNDEDDNQKRLDDIVRELSERTSNGKLQLKQSFYNELDPRWAFFTAEEKANVRRLQANQHQSQSDTFAPTRKSGMERMQAPGTAVPPTVSPEIIPTPPSSRPCSGGSNSKKTPPLTNDQNSSPASSPVPDSSINDVSMSSGHKRKAHVPSSVQQQQHQDKRARQESASPPEDPRSNPPSHKEKLIAARAGGSTTSSRLSSPCSLNSPSQPSCDWEKTLSEIKDSKEAEKYFSMFHTDYPVYLECYHRLSKVSAEFKVLEEKLKTALHQKTSGRDKIERTIQERFAHFDKDEDFLKCRQRHYDLRLKLTVLKQRISDWERLQGISPTAT